MDTLTTAEFAAILKIKPQSLRARLIKRPESLPKPAKRGRGSHVIWLKKDVEAWLVAGLEEKR